jgi:hypothetical protein
MSTFMWAYKWRTLNDVYFLVNIKVNKDQRCVLSFEHKGKQGSTMCTFRWTLFTFMFTWKYISFIHVHFYVHLKVHIVDPCLPLCSNESTHRWSLFTFMFTWKYTSLTPVYLNVQIRVHIVDPCSLLCSHESTCHIVDPFLLLFSHENRHRWFMFTSMFILKRKKRNKINK